MQNGTLALQTCNVEVSLPKSLNASYVITATKEIVYLSASTGM